MRQGPKRGRGVEPSSPKIFSMEPEAPLLGWVEPQHFTLEPGALETFAAESVAPNIKIRAFL